MRGHNLLHLKNRIPYFKIIHTMKPEIHFFFKLRYMKLLYFLNESGHLVYYTKDENAICVCLRIYRDIFF